MKTRALLLAVLLLTAGCARAGTEAEPIASGGNYGSGVDLEGLDAEKTAAPKASARTEGGTQATNPPAGGAIGGGSSGGTAPVVPKREVDDYGTTGTMAINYLRPEHTKLVVEITAVEGKAPNAGSLQMLKTRLSEVVSKRSGVEILPVQTIPASKTNYTIKDVMAIEQRYRKRFSDKFGPTVVMHFLFLNGHVSDASGALGIAYRASSIVMLPDRIDSIATPIFSSAEIERACTVHEAGHLLGLVNIGYKSPRNHEDPTHKGHSRNLNSVMYYALERVELTQILTGELPTTFDADDKADLADLKALRL